jgi:hypothetical protein
VQTPLPFNFPLSKQLIYSYYSILSLERGKKGVRLAFLELIKRLIYFSPLPSDVKSCKVML